MIWIIAGLMAAAVSFLANRFTYRVWSESALLGPIPLAEEVAKTMIAYFLGTSIFYTHLAFGITEAFLDWHGQRRGIPAAISAIIAHALFGLITMAATQMAGAVGVGIATAFFAHSVWNAVALFRTVKR